MKPRILFVTGNDTGVGKTVFAAMFTRSLRAEGVRVAALKPICSGGRGDARALHAAAGKVLPLDAVNPWHFRAPLAPVLAARREHQRLHLRAVAAQVRQVANGFELVVVEGAGGLLSPLGEGFDSRDLIAELHATPIVVCANRLGAVNQARLVQAALPAATARRALFVLVNGRKPDRASRDNPELLQEFIDAARIIVMPYLRGGAART